MIPRNCIRNTIFILTILMVFIKTVDAWSCGIGKVSNTLSFLITLPSDLIGVNRCCEEHDTLIDDLHVAREEADRLFCNCMENNPDWWVRNIVKPLFCKSVEIYSKWFINGKTEEELGRFGERLKFQWNF